jgi:hypothetical protein
MQHFLLLSAAVHVTFVGSEGRVRMYLAAVTQQQRNSKRTTANTAAAAAAAAARNKA